VVRKAVLAFILLGLLGLGVWFLVFSPQAVEPLQTEFEQNYGNAVPIWQNRGIDSPFLHEGFDALVALPQSEVVSLKSKLEEKESVSAAPDEKALLDAYADMAELALQVQALALLEQQIRESEGTVCDNSVLYGAYVSEVEKTVRVFEAFSTKANSFVKTYPAQAGSVFFFAMGSNGSFFENLKVIKHDMDAARELCE